MINTTSKPIDNLMMKLKLEMKHYLQLIMNIFQKKIKINLKEDQNGDLNPKEKEKYINQ